MNMARAKELAMSGERATVTYDGKPVYIQHVEEDGMVRIYDLSNREQEWSVPASSLVEVR